MSNGKVRIFCLGDSALTVEFGNTISTALNQKAIALADHFDQAPFPGFIESTPAYCSTTVFYDLIEVRRHFPDFSTAFEAVRRLTLDAVDSLAISQTEPARTVNIPVNFDNRAAPDLEYVAEKSNLSRRRVIEIFTAMTYRVFMVGSVPAFFYMGVVDKRIAVPRKTEPRLRVPGGSVGIGGRQTGIYPVESPGGWQLIGRTDLEPFGSDYETRGLLQPGDQVRFIAC